MHRNQELLDRLTERYKAGLYNPDDDPDLEEICWDPATHEHPDVSDDDLLHILRGRRRVVTLSIEVDLAKCSSRGYYVYGLVDPRTHHIRYVGKSNKPFSRLVEHVLLETISNRQLTAWLKELVDADTPPSMTILKVADTESEVLRLESEEIRSRRHLDIFNIRD